MVIAKTNKVLRNIIKKKWIQNIFLLVFSVFIAFNIGEIIIRLLYSKEIVLFPRYVTDVKYGKFRIRGNIPNSNYQHKSYDGEWDFTINQKGFRSAKNYKYKKENGILRILSLGDSFTMGYETDMDKTFSAYLEQKLNKSGIKAEVINAGVSGYGTVEEIVFYENEGFKYQPDIVILGYYNNDPLNNLMANIYSIQNDSLVILNTDYLPAINLQNRLQKIFLYRWLSGHSYLFNFVRNYLSTKVQNSVVEKNSENLKIKDNNERLNYQNKLTELLLQKLYNVVKKYNAKFIILDIPNSSNVQSLSKTFKQNNEIADSIIIMCDTFKLSWKSGCFYRPNGNWHWTETAHEMASTKIFNAIRKEY